MTETTLTRKEKNIIEVMKCINDEISKQNLKQKDVAAKLGIKQPRVSDIKNLKYSKFSIGTLLEYLSEFGHEVVLEKDSKGSSLLAKIKST